MLKKIFLTSIMILSCLCLLFIHSSEGKVTNLKIKNGSVEYQGINFPVFTGIKKVTTTPENSVYSGGITFDIKTCSFEDSEKQAQEIISFYKNKKIGSVNISPEFKKSGKGNEIFYNSTSKNDSGKSLSIMIAVTKSNVSVVIIAN